ncbi:Bifunctional epoxide hydrolase 2 [Pseudocercospora fuligena]|uniref:Bifunctional epoxide hydrolase 2 n=1 Tax=Pseudocercospora fuligena TaxID=685502 RepID=A0A8H6RMI0_9PEZI|nr:Bifunctional epoxide hydrolase 2 [Pseudocercospora fuligena]
MTDHLDLAKMAPPSKNIKATKIRPSDIGNKVKSQYATVNGHRWHYLDTPSEGSQKGTIFLIHGFPDISFAWRYQIPLFSSLGFRSIALDCMGYGNTGSSSSLSDFSFKTHAEAVAGIAKSLGITRAVIGGHDWGGMAVYRIAQWKPELISHVFSVATAYAPIQNRFVSTRELVESGSVPQFGYQLQFGSEDDQVERVIKDGDEGRMRKFLLGMYGGKVKSGKRFMTPEMGIDLRILEDESDEVAMTPLLNEEELDYYVKEFLKNGVHGPCNWYRTRKVNFEDELEMQEERRKVVRQPTLYILATKDNILTREMSRGMEKAIPNLTSAEVDAGHWALWHTPDETNAILEDWLLGVVLGGKSKL